MTENEHLQGVISIRETRRAMFAFSKCCSDAGALEAARQQGMRDMLAEVHHLELAYASAMNEAFDEDVTGEHPTY